ncbi:MAG: GDP-mannose 4,6-dehydratase [Candidatus Heimdallarchaeota archaeon]
MTKSLVTGGAGFIGYHLTKYLITKGHEVTILDNFSDYYSEKIKRTNAKELQQLGVNVVEGSILQREDLQNAITDQCEYVFHFAAQPGVRYSTMNPERSLRINVEGTSHVLSICKEVGIRKIVVASSSSVFGLQEYLPIDETHPKNPISYYGASKLATEKIVEVSRHLYNDLDISIVRPFTVIGARQRPDMAINLFISRALKETPIIIYGDGKQTRDWTHVENIVEGTYLMAVKSGGRNEDFNIGSGIRTSVNDVLEMISEITSKKLKIEYKPFDKADVKDTLADISKAKELLDYSPKKSLKIAIEDFIKDYQETNLY